MVKAKDDSVRRFQTEPEAKQWLQDQLSPSFSIMHEVKAIGPERDEFFIDMVAQCKATGYRIGIEAKKSHLYKQEFSRTIRQAIHYRLARVTDPRLADYQGKQLPTVAIFPDWLGEHDERDVLYDREAEGMRLVGAQMRVSFLRENDSHGLSLHAGQAAIFHLDQGWLGNADGWLFGKRGLASKRRQDKLEL